MKIVLRRIVLIYMLAWVSLPFPALAQNTSEIVVLHTVETPQGQADGLIMRSYFTLRAANGDPILKNDTKLNEEGIIRLESDGRDARAVISEPDSPIKIVLLLDASGSMATHIEVAKKAALATLDDLPERTQLYVYQFNVQGINQAIGSPTSFSSNRELWQEETNIWRSVAGAGTCLYNTAFQAVQLLAQAAESQERRAVILFTDGVDELSNGEQCSERGPQNAILSANEHNIPFYTIGLCETQNCNTIDEAGLAELARETKGADVVGQAEQMEERFQTIMAILDSQWMARATLYPRKGPNTVRLEVTPEGATAPILGSFTLNAQLDYYPPPRFNPDPTYDEKADQYLLQLNGTQLNSLGGLTVQIRNVTRGTLEQTLPIATENVTQPITISAQNFDAESEYCFQVRATNREGRSFQLEQEELKEGADPAVLAESCVTYTPTFGFTINSVTQQWDTNKLLIDVALTGFGTRNVLFDGTITSKSGTPVLAINRVAPDENGLMIFDLPSALQQAPQGEQFILKLRTDAGGETLERELDIFKDRPSSTGLYIAISLGVVFTIVVAITGVLFYRRWRENTVVLPAPLQYNELTQRQDKPQSAEPPRRNREPRSPQLRIRVVKTTDPTQKREVFASTFPYLIGRGERDTQLFIAGDNGVSRQHLQIKLDRKQLVLVDLQSANGTFVNEQPVEPDQPVPISAAMQVRLGPNTLLEIEPL
jgi:Mg-chelatase subunit ChlD